MSEYVVEIGRLTVCLENIFLESGNLSTNFFVHLEKSLRRAEEIKDSSLKEINEWWALLQEDFSFSKASECIACGKCEGVCPQHLPITELLKEAVSKLES